MFDVLVNGHKTSDYTNIWVANIPQIQPSETERDRYTIPQRDGDMLSAYYRRTSAYIEVTFHALNILQNRRIIKSVFCNQINEVLKTSITFPTISIINRVNGVDSYDSYFNIKNAVITEEELRDGDYGRVTIQYEVEPFEYMRTDTEFEQIVPHTTSPLENPIIVRVHNDGDLCKPLINITPLASGKVTTAYNFGVGLTIDEESESIIVYPSKVGTGLTRYAYCDTSLMYTYLTNGTTVTLDTVTLGEEYFTQHNYEDLWIPNGTHDIRFMNVALNNYSTKVNIKLRKGYVI